MAKPKPLSLLKHTGGGNVMYNRLDPYFSGIWNGNMMFSWANIRELRLINENLDKTKNLFPLLSLNTAWKRVSNKKTLYYTAQIIGILSSHRTATSEQLAALAGVEYDKTFFNHLYNMFCAELLELGTLNISIMQNTDKRYWGWRLIKRKENIRKIMNILPNYIAYATCAGVFPRGGLQHDRHNILSTEYLLRASENIPNIVIAGETHTGVPLLYPQTVSQYNKRADGVIFRDDGLGILLETTASSVGMEIRKKIKNWLELIQKNLDKEYYLLFLYAPKKFSVNSFQRLLDIHEKLVKEEYSAYYYAQSVQRIGFAHWEEHYGKEKISAAGLDLECHFYNLQNQNWQSHSLLKVVNNNPRPYIYDNFSATFTTPPKKGRKNYPLWALPLLEQQQQTVLIQNQPTVLVQNQPTVSTKPAQPEWWS